MPAYLNEKKKISFAFHIIRKCHICEHELSFVHDCNILYAKGPSMYWAVLDPNRIYLKGYCTVFQHALKLLEMTGIVLP